MTALTCLGKSLGLALTAWVVAANPVLAEKRYGPGVSDDAIKIGQTMPYSGPVSAWATLGRAEAAYVAMINERGGINGRKLRLISLDDGYSPPRTVEQTRKLIEQEQVLFLFSTFGTPTNTAILSYTNARHVPEYVPRRDRQSMGRSATLSLEHLVVARSTHRSGGAGALSGEEPAALENRRLVSKR